MKWNIFRKVGKQKIHLETPICRTFFVGGCDKESRCFIISVSQEDAENIQGGHQNEKNKTTKTKKDTFMSAVFPATNMLVLYANCCIYLGDKWLFYCY